MLLYTVYYYLMRHQLVTLLTAATFCVLPFLPWFALPNSVSGKYFLLIAVVDTLLLLYAWHMVRVGRTISARRPILISVALLTVSLLISMFAGVSASHSFWGDTERLVGVYFLLHMIAWSLVLGTMLHIREWGMIRKGIALGAGAGALLTIIGTAGLGYQGPLLWLDLAKSDPLFGNATYAGMYLMLALLLGLIEYMKTEGKKWRILLGSSLGAIVLSPVLLNIIPLVLGRIELSTVIVNPSQMLGLTRASGTVLIATILFLLGWWAASKLSNIQIRKGAKYLMAGGAATACLIGSLLFITPGSVVQQLYLDETTIGRFIVWESAKDAIAERPLLGWGEGNFERAFETHYDPQLYVELGRVAWFDRAHNVVLDTLVSGGVIGSVVMVLVTGAYLMVIYRARKRGDIGEAEAVILGVLPFAHFVQLQTAFDVIPTYALLAAAGGYALTLERGATAGKALSKPKRRYIAVVIVLAASASLYASLFYDLPRQLSMLRSLGERNGEVRSALIKDSLSRPSDFEGLHYATSQFIMSVFETLERTNNKESVLAHAHRFIELYLAAHERHLGLEPDHYRARINYAYLLLVRQAWGGEVASAKALQILEDARPLSPGNPLTEVLVMMAHAYAGDRASAEAALDSVRTLAPESALTEDAEAWLTKQGSELPPKTFHLIANI